ncbi:MAG: hypothetical protein LCH34_05945 [Firmicutes bacterium]|nr:hypothetical protein [Bacillota bacterium]
MILLRNHTRLHGDIYAVYRKLSKREQIEKWTNDAVEVLECVPYDRVSWRVTLEGEAVILTFHLMRCAVKTEYCTEVHAVCDNSEHLEDLKQPLADLLEKLRRHFNKDWVIQDRDLTAGTFRNM